MDKQVHRVRKSTLVNPPQHLKVITGASEQTLIRRQFLIELQTTLELEALLRIFFEELNHFVPCRGLRYLHAEAQLDHRLGIQARHRTEYQLAIGQEELGEIHLSRRTPFTPQELYKMETLITALALPLRNALHYQRALQAASIDPLTGLKNRRSYSDNLGREISRARREGQSLGLMVIDLDDFKRINDDIGHLAGDQVLVHVATLLRSAVRRSDMVFRFAGDEFVLLLPNVKAEGMAVLTQRIRQTLAAHPCRYGPHRIPVSVSIGTALLEEGMDGDALFKAADLAMFCQKAHKHRAS